MGEVVNVLVAVAVIVLVVRWASSGSKDNDGTPSPSAVLRFRPKNATPEMVDSVQNVFPDIPRYEPHIFAIYLHNDTDKCSVATNGDDIRRVVDNIHYDLLRTGSVQQTSNKIVENGHLAPPPPGYYRIYPRTAEQAASAQHAETPNGSASATAGPSKSKKPDNLLTRYNLGDRASTTSVSIAPEAVGGKSIWEDSAEKREASLRERKAQMVLAARQRLLAKEAENSSTP